MSTPTDRVYTESHEWIKHEGDTITLGLTRFAVDQLTDVTYVELKEVGTHIDQSESLGEVESVKTTNDVYTPIAGEIIAINEAVVENPALLNEDPYEAGWLVKLRCGDLSGLEGLMDGAAYDEQHA